MDRTREPPSWHDRDSVLEVRGRALTIAEQGGFERAFVVALLILLEGALGYVWGPFEGQLKVALTVSGVGLLATLFTLRWVGRREAIARLDALGVTTWNPGRVPPPTVPWSLVAGYRDGDPDVVVLELTQRVGLRRSLVVPTLTEAERVSVLARLDGQGIERLES